MELLKKGGGGGAGADNEEGKIYASYAQQFCAISYQEFISHWGPSGI